MSKTISGIVTWLKQWFYTKDEIYDTGWQDFPYRNHEYFPILWNGSIQEVFANALMANYTDQPLRVRRIGKIVHIEGAFTSGGDIIIDNSFPLKELCCGEHNNTTYNGDFLFTIGTLDEKFRPSKSIITVQQGSGQNKYLVRIDPSGAVRIGRYCTTSYANPAKNCWLNINVSYTVGD